VSREFQPRATYGAAVLQAGAAVWLLLEPGGLPLAIFAAGLAALTIWLARGGRRRQLIQIGLLLLVIGVLFAFSGGLIVAACAALLLAGLAIDWLLAGPRVQPSS
jgi:hypothetical protein